MTEQPVEPNAAQHADHCPKCKRPLVTVHDVRGGTMDGKCFTRYAYRDPNAAKDCELAAVVAQHAQPASTTSEMTSMTQEAFDGIVVAASEPGAVGLREMEISAASVKQLDEVLSRPPRTSIVPKQVPPASDSSEELPDKPGLWYRNGVGYLIGCNSMGDMFGQRVIEGHAGVFTNFQLDKGGWHPAAPAGEREEVDTEQKLRGGWFMAARKFSDDNERLQEANAALQAKLDAVAGLVEKWREAAIPARIGRSLDEYDAALERCADELEISLAGGGK